MARSRGGFGRGGYYDSFRGNPELSSEEQAINNRQRIAQMIMMQGLEQPKQRTFGNNRPVRQHWAEPAGQLAKLAAGMYMNYKADQQHGELADKNREQIQAGMEQFRNTYDGTPEVPEIPEVVAQPQQDVIPPQGDGNNPDNPYKFASGQHVPAVVGQDAVAAVPAVPGDPERAMMDGLTSDSKYIREMSEIMLRDKQRDERLVNAITLRDKMEKGSGERTGANNVSREGIAAGNNTSREEIAAVNNTSREGIAQAKRDNEELRRQDLKEHRDNMYRLKRDEINQKRQERIDKAGGDLAGTKSIVSATLDSLTDAYTELDDLGLSIDSENSAGSNIINRIRSSGLGQGVEGFLGTEAQRWRDEINALRPGLLNAIRQATKMGARGLDSNKELDFWLQMATDTTRNRSANKAAIAYLENNYGNKTISRQDQIMVDKLKNEFEDLPPSQEAEIEAAKDSKLLESTGETVTKPRIVNW